MAAKFPGYWCRTTLHYRGWSIGRINVLLDDPDLILKNRTKNGTDAHYYAIERVLSWEKAIRTSAKRNQRSAEIIAPIKDFDPSFLNDFDPLPSLPEVISPRQVS